LAGETNFYHFRVYFYLEKMSEYKQVKLGKLKLKGQGNKEKKKNKKKRKHEYDVDTGASDTNTKQLEEIKKYNGWWPLQAFDHLNCGTVAIQTSIKNAYVFAVDNGTLSLGSDHDVQCDGLPRDEEVFTLIKISENKVALKTGYG